MEKVQMFFQENPRIFGLLLMITGVTVFISIKNNSKWITETNKSTYDLRKIDGWINIFGKRAGKIIGYFVAVLIIVSGIAYIVLWK